MSGKSRSRPLFFEGGWSSVIIGRWRDVRRGILVKAVTIPEFVVEDGFWGGVTSARNRVCGMLTLKLQRHGTTSSCCSSAATSYN